jgi:hypothetical protein
MMRRKEERQLSLKDAAIFAYQTDRRTDRPNDGIFTLVTGSAPNRVFNIEWRTTYETHHL